jgi:hypothetical protein
VHAALGDQIYDAETLGEIDSAVSLNLAKQYVASCEEAIRDREGNRHGSHDA